MNINLLRLLTSEDHRSVLSEVGYDQYQKLLEVSDQFVIVGDKLMKKFKNTMREIPAPKDRFELLKEIHTNGGHVGVVKLYKMVRMIYYWPHLIDDCVELVESCIDCSKMKYKP
jgi:Integrase zinc binding domain